jgi:hypothetical protein
MELSSIGSDRSFDDLPINMSAVVNSDEIIAMDTDEEIEMASAKALIQSKTTEKHKCAASKENVPKNTSKKAYSTTSQTKYTNEVIFKIPDPVHPSCMKAQQRQLKQNKATEVGKNPPQSQLLPLCCITRLLEKYPNYPGPRKVKVRRNNPELLTAPDGEHKQN